MTRSLRILAVSAFAVAGLGLATDAMAQTKFYDQSGGFRGYAWCRKIGMDIGDCNYYNLSQCQATGLLGPAYCVPNPFTPAGRARKQRRATY